MARVRPSGDHATESTASVWPVRGSQAAGLAGVGDVPQQDSVVAAGGGQGAAVG